MATFILRRSDVFPVGTVVGAYPVTSPPAVDGPPGGATTETATVAADGSATFTTLAADRVYTFAAQVAGTWRRVRGQVSAAASARAVGTASTTSGSTALTAVTATSGAFVPGQLVTGPGIPPGTYIFGGSGSAFTMTDKATATATGVPIEGHGATTWRARARQRRHDRGTA